MKPQFRTRLPDRGGTVSHCNEIVTNRPAHGLAFLAACHLEGALGRFGGAKSRTRLIWNRARLPGASLISPEIGLRGDRAPPRLLVVLAPWGAAVAIRTRRRSWVGRMGRRILDLADQGEFA